jgi:CRISPR-associated endonuclease/helicase Cas3
VIYAKSSKFGYEETLDEHTKQVLLRWDELKRTKYLNNDWVDKFDTAVIKCLEYHDLGKANPEFQDRIGNTIIKGKFKRIPHGWLSVAFISDEDMEYFNSIVNGDIDLSSVIDYAVMFHHNRKDVSQEDYEEMLSIMGKHKKELEIQADFDMDFLPDYKDIRRRLDNSNSFEKYLPYRVFFKGALHKCDYSASAHIEAEIPYNGNYTKDFNEWLEWQEWHKKYGLREYQKEALANSSKSIVLIASTGMGKTECSMNWINGGKAFYLLGIKTAVNAMYERFCGIFGKNISLLHGESNFVLIDELSEESEENDNYVYLRKLDRTRQMSYPMTIATADQLVPSVFKYSGFELIYFIASYSKIIVDEIQSFSPESIAVIVSFLADIHKLGGRFLLMTATLPPFIKKEFENLDGVVFPDPALLEINRHSFCFTGTDIIDETDNICKFYEEGNKVLVICNTVKKAQEVYEKLSDLEAELLHSRFTYQDRNEKERAIFEASNSKKSCIWIATQIVEASLNIDFDILFTESATIDSLFQRFGRCYRKREYKSDVPNIFIANRGMYDHLIYDCDIHNRTEEILQNYAGRAITEIDKQDIIEKVFDMEFIKNTEYYEKYLKYKELLKLGFRASNQSEAQYLFRKIAPQVNIIPEPLYEENKETIDNLLNLIDNKAFSFIERVNAKKDLKNYIVSIQSNPKGQDLRSITTEFAVRNTILNNEGIWILNNCEYTSKKGLVLTEKLEEKGFFI